jgi:uncharacterized protein (DUF58 family)
VISGLRPTWRGIWAATVMFGIIMAAVVTGDSTLLLVLAAVALPLAAAPVVVVRRARRADGIELQMIVAPPVVPIGSPCDLMVRLTHDRGVAPPPMSLERPSDHWHVGFGRGHLASVARRRGRFADSDGVAVAVGRLSRWDQISSEDGLSRLPLPTGRRGVFTFGPLRMWVHDPFGLFGRTVAFATPVTLVVHPQAAVMATPQTVRSGSSGLAQVSEGSLAGHSDDPGGEWSGLRPYEPGDRLNLLSWQAEARSGALLVHDFRPDSEDVISLVLDDRAGVHRRDAFERSLSMIYGLTVQADGLTTDFEVSTLSGRQLRGSTTPEGLVDLATFLAETQPSRRGGGVHSVVPTPGGTLLVTTPTAAPTLPPWFDHDAVVVVE